MCVLCDDDDDDDVNDMMRCVSPVDSSATHIVIIFTSCLFFYNIVCAFDVYFSIGQLHATFKEPEKLQYKMNVCVCLCPCHIPNGHMHRTPSLQRAKITMSLFCFSSRGRVNFALRILSWNVNFYGKCVRESNTGPSDLVFAKRKPNYF